MNPCEVAKIHQDIVHTIAEILISKLRRKYWPLDMDLEGQEAIRTCERCQLKLGSNILSISLQQIRPALPLKCRESNL